MISGRHRHKLIDGLVIAMGKPDSGRAAPRAMEGEGGEGDGDRDEMELDEGGPSEERKDDEESLSCARDAARALGMSDLDDDQARAFAEAIRKLAGGY